MINREQFPKFFEGKPTEHLIGEEIEAEHLNDDRLGRRSLRLTVGQHYRTEPPPLIIHD